MSRVSGFMGRLVFLSGLGRDHEGRIVEIPRPPEPAPYDVPTDLYCPVYGIGPGILGPPKITKLLVTIFNTKAYRRDPPLEEAAKDRLLEAILRREGPEVVEASGGEQVLRGRVEVDTFWIEWGKSRWSRKR
jgi:hypothetical protein